MMEYPKIETLYNRDEKFKVKPDEVRLPEFDLVNRWLITEKIDGTNIRVVWQDDKITFGGRTDNAQIPAFLLATLQQMFTEDAMRGAFQSEEGEMPRYIDLFGEGYGEKIQKVGSRYRSGTSFRLFDVWVDGWWLNWSNVKDVAKKLNIQTVPVLTHFGRLIKSPEELEWHFESGKGHSQVTLDEDGDSELIAEGVVARTDPLLFDRKGHRIMWKLKFKDFAE